MSVSLISCSLLIPKYFYIPHLQHPARLCTWMSQPGSTSVSLCFSPPFPLLLSPQVIKVPPSTFPRSLSESSLLSTYPHHKTNHQIPSVLLPKYLLKLASLSVPTVQTSFLVLFTFYLDYCTSRWQFPSTPVQYPHYSPNFLPKNKIWPYPLKTWPVPHLFLIVQCPICSTQGSNLVFQPISCLTHVFF